MHQTAHTNRLQLAILAAACLTLGGNSTRAAEPAPGNQWKKAATVRLKGLTVELSQPVLVARSKGFLWFPTLLRRENGDLLAVMSNYADVHTNKPTANVCFSTDGGLTWSQTQDGVYGEAGLPLAGGDTLILPYYLMPREGGGMRGGYQIWPQGQRTLKQHDSGLTVTGWMRPDRSIDEKLGLAGFVFNGQTVPLRDGRTLATLYGYFQGSRRYSLVAAESADGVAWNVRSIIADENCSLPGDEGPCESALCRLKDGRLMCVFRLASGVPYGQAYSEDDGKTWSKAVALQAEEGSETPHSVQPSLAVRKDGSLVLSGGRPGLFVWLNMAGDGATWQSVNLQQHHNACVPEEPIGHAGQTSAYTEVVPLDDANLLCIYDRIPFGWSAIPADSHQTNSVWVVRLSVNSPAVNP